MASKWWWTATLSRRITLKEKTYLVFTAHNESVARLTVVTAFGLIGTVATGFLGMNLFDHTGLSALEKVAMFAAVFVPTLVLTFYTIAKSQRLSSFLDALGNETMGVGEKLSAFVRVWRR